ncbi:hypothetical protein [Shewanella atlantica]|uniref:hypothetical protein n=1 Tax=Shewanella atlantica TaxID=271099 RepID=UPI0037352875
MKKVFNASILAAAVALSFGANAADVEIDTKLSITQEAAAAGVASAEYGATFTFYNREELAAGDIVTITFPIGTVIDAAETFIGAGVGSFDPAVVADSGSATKNPTVKLTVATGSPVLANSKTLVYLGNNTGTNAVPVLNDGFLPKVGNAVYTAEDGFSGTPKDTTGSNTVALTTSTAQETASVATKFNGFIKRDARGTFETSKGTLVAEVTVARPAATTKAAVASETLVITGKNFDTVTQVEAAICSDGSAIAADLTSGQPVFADAGCAGAATAIKVPVLAAAATCGGVACVAPAKPDTFTIDTATLTAVLPAAVAPATGVAGKFAVAFTSDTTKTFPTGSLTVDRSVEYTKVTATTNPVFDYIKDADFGKFQLDASVVNVPYLPVGYGLTPNVEIANAGSTDAAIQLEGFDQYGVAYGPVAITTVAKKGAVTKVSEGDIQTAFGLADTDKKKLSVTFVLDADAEDITLAPYYRQNESRVNVMSDQYKK